VNDLAFTVLDIRPEPYAMTPNLIARLRVAETSGAAVHTALLRCQVKLDVHRRPYSDAEERGLLDLFGPRQRWADTLKPFSWIHTTALVPGFAGEREVDLVLPCSYDVEVAGSRYLSAVRDGVVPLEFLFSGTVFARGATGFEVTQIPWDREARYDLPVATWRELMDRYFPNSGWLRLDVATLDALAAYKAAHGLTSWDETLTSLLAGREQVI
jgi:Family of unknown function (DUF6084)